MELKYKPRYKSKTYGFGALLLLGGAVLGLPQLKAMVETLPAEYQAGALFVAGLLTWVIREFTDGPVGAPPESGGPDRLTGQGQEGDADG